MEELLTSGREPRPLYTMKVGKKDITDRFEDRLIELTLTDNSGFDADMLEIELDDADNLLKLPEKGMRLSLSLGWAHSGVEDKGIHKVDELEHSGPPDRLIIRARSAELDGCLTTRRENSYADKTLSDVVQAIALRNSLTHVTGHTLAGQIIERIDQTGESDANFLSRLAPEFDAIATVKNGTLLFVPADEPTSASGARAAEREHHPRLGRPAQLQHRRARELQRRKGLLPDPKVTIIPTNSCASFPYSGKFFASPLSLYLFSFESLHIHGTFSYHFPHV